MEWNVWWQLVYSRCQINCRLLAAGCWHTCKCANMAKRIHVPRSQYQDPYQDPTRTCTLSATNAVTTFGHTTCSLKTQCIDTGTCLEPLHCANLNSKCITSRCACVEQYNMQHWLHRGTEHTDCHATVGQS